MIKKIKGFINFWLTRNQCRPASSQIEINNITEFFANAAFGSMKNAELIIDNKQLRAQLHSEKKVNQMLRNERRKLRRELNALKMDKGL
jgi:cell division protein FtsB